MSNNKQTAVEWLEKEIYARGHIGEDTPIWLKELYKQAKEMEKQQRKIELPSDEEIESRYNKFIDTEIKLGFLKQEQGERLKWYYKTYFIDKIQGGNNEQQ